MFNSLPNSLKEKIRSEYHLRLFIVIFTSIICIQVFFLVLLFPSWLISFQRQKEVILQTNKTNELSLNSEIKSVTSQVELINTKLNIINSTLEYPEVLPYVDSILSKKTNNIYIKGITYTSSGKNSSNITLSGEVATRESLVLFVKELEKLGIFKRVDLPISNFTKDKNINFSINITIDI